MSIRINVGATFDARDIKNARKELDALEDEARQLTGALATTVRGFEKISRGATMLGLALSKIIVPMVGAGIASITTAADFQQSMSKIVGLVGIAASEVKAMESAVLNLSRKTAKAPQELADALFVVTSAGLRGAQATQALEASAKAAAAGLGTTGDIARSVAGIMNSYGSKVGSAANVTDVLVATARAGNFETSQLAGALGRVLPFATQAQVSLEDLGGAIALLTRTNGNAAESITQVQSLFRAFVVPTEEAKKVLDSVGLSAAGLRTQIGSQGLVATLRTLDGALGGNRENLGRLLGSSEAASAAFQILDADAFALAGTFGVTNDAVGLTDAAFNNAADQSAFKFEQALNDLKTIAVKLGEILLPFATELAEKFLDLTESFSELTDTQKKQTLFYAAIAAGIVAVIIVAGALAAAITAILTLLAPFIGGAGGVAVFFSGLAAGITGIVLGFQDMEKRAESAAAAVRACVLSPDRSSARQRLCSFRRL
jgi:TP901 family phage tail tape measure protein